MSPKPSSFELKTAVMFGKFDEIKKYVQNKKNDINKIWEDGSLLTMASWYGRYDIVKFLIEQGADPNIEEGAPLYKGLFKNKHPNYDVIRLLLSEKANINQLYYIDADVDESSLLTGALYYGYVDMAYFLLNAGIDVNLKSKNGYTAFTWCYLKNFAKIGRVIIDKGFCKEFSDEDEEAYYNKILKLKDPHDNYMPECYNLETTSKKSVHNSGNPNLKMLFADESLPGCNNPPIHLLSVDLSKIETMPEEIKNIGMLHVLYSNCQGCEEPEFLYFQIAENGTLSLYQFPEEDENSEDEYEEYDDDDEENETRCNKSDYTPSKKMTYLELQKKSGTVSEITIGGLPPWLQSPQWPSCPECGDSSFYVGCIDQSCTPPGAEGPGNFIYVFTCPKHRTITLVKQNT